MLKEYFYSCYTERVTRTFAKSGYVQRSAVIGHIISRLASVISSTKTSSAGPESSRVTRNTSVENMYTKQSYQSSMGGSVAMEMVPASKCDLGQSEGGLQPVSYVDGDEEHVYDDTC